MGFLPRYPLVRVHWIDATTFDAWHDEDTERKVTETVTVGYLLRRSRGQLELAPTLTADRSVASVWVIPRGMVVRVERLR